MWGGKIWTDCGPVGGGDEAGRVKAEGGEDVRGEADMNP